MGRLEKEIELKKELSSFEDDIFDGKDVDFKKFYKLKKELLDFK